MSYRISPRVLVAGPKIQQITPFASALWQRGYEVRTASTGLDCLSELRDWHPDLLVMNPDMYWGSGIGLLGVMYDDAGVPVVPVILVADERAGIKAQLRPEWSCRVLRSSISPDYLCVVVDEMLHQSRFAKA